jgi:hypothetical protein
MSSQKIYCGRCLCGAVRFTAAPEKAEMAICHCGMCRRWAGGVFMAVDCSQKFEIEDDRHLGLYQSSPWGQRQDGIPNLLPLGFVMFALLAIPLVLALMPAGGLARGP